MAKVRVTAKKRGTFVSSVSGQIIRFDPKGKDDRSKRPIVDTADLVEILKKGLIDDPSAGDTAAPEAVVDVPDLTAEDVARARVAATSKIDDDAGPVTSGLSTVAATNFDPASEAGRNQAEIDQDPPHRDEGLTPDDPDAPPAKKTAAKKGAEGGEAKKG